MSNKIKLNAKTREKKENINSIKAAGYIPVVVYGPGVENQNLKINKVEFEKVYNLAGESNLIDLIVEKNEPIPVLVKDIEKNPIKNTVIHVDFYQVDMNKQVTAEIQLNFIGEPRAIKEVGAFLVKNIDTLEVKCLPGNLVDKIDVDISGLEKFNDALRVGDIKLPEGIVVTQSSHEIVVTVVEPHKEEVIVKTEVKAATPEAKKEVKKEVKKEDKSKK